MKKLSVLIGFVCLAVGCGVPPVARTIVSSFPIDKPFDSVWGAVIETFAELNLPILNMEKASGLITTDWISFKGQDNIGYCDCGKLGLYVEIARQGRFNVYAKKVDEASCELKVNSVFQRITHMAFDRDPTPIVGDCVSTGKLEAEIYRRVSEKIK
jgi:hypothetical protein